MRNAFVVRSLFIVFGLLCGFVVMELAFRLIDAPSTVHASKLDRPMDSYTAKARLNRFRDFFHPHDKPKNTFRILNVGDSFTYAGKVLVQDSYSIKLSQMLNDYHQETEHKFEVVKAGLPGLNVYREASLSVSMADRYHPDMVLLQLFLNDAELVPFKYSDHGVFVRKLDSYSESSFVSSFKSLSFVSSRLRDYIRHIETIDYYRSLYNDPVLWRGYKLAIKNLKTKLAKKKIKLVVVLFPSLGGSLGADTYEFQAIHEQIGSFMTKRGVYFIDLLDSYLDLDPIRLQAIPGVDSHPNEIAHRIAAESIFTFLKSKDLIPDINS